MRNPNFGNKWRFVPNTRFDRNMAGELRVFQGTVPTWQGFSVSYEALSFDEMLSMETLLLSAAGNVITLTDFEGRNWTGVVTSDQIEITQGRRVIDPITGDDVGCNWTIGFDFEGQVSGTIKDTTSTDTSNFTTAIQVAMMSATVPTNSPLHPSNTVTPSPEYPIPTLTSHYIAYHDSLNQTGASAVDQDTVTQLIDEVGGAFTDGSGVYNANTLNGQPAVAVTVPFVGYSTVTANTYTFYVVGRYVQMRDTSSQWIIGNQNGLMDQIRAGAWIYRGTQPDDGLCHLYTVQVDAITGKAIFYKDAEYYTTVIGAFYSPELLVVDHGEIGEFGFYKGLFDMPDLHALMQRVSAQYGVGT